jgi:hypothetical protein
MWVSHGLRSAEDSNKINPTYFFKLLHHKTYQSPALSDASLIPLLTFERLYISILDDIILERTEFGLHGVHTKFHENRGVS